MATVLMSSLRAAAGFPGLHVAPAPAPAATVALPAKLGRGGRLRAQATYNVKLITPSGEVKLKMPDDDYIMNYFEEKLGTDLPFTCRAGVCSTCAGKIVSGSVDQSEQNFLDDEQVADGWVLTCVARPASDVVIKTHKEKDLMDAY